MSSSVTLGVPLYRAPSVRRVAAYLGLVGAALAPLWLLLGRHNAVGAWSLAVNVAACAATLVGISLNYPATRRPWYLLAGALGCFAAAGATSLVYVHRDVAQPFPSAVDGFRLVAYALLIAALVLFVRRRTPARDWASIVDAGIVSLGVTALVWAFVLEPAVGSTPAGRAQLAAIALMAANVGLVAVTVRLLLAEGLRTFLHRCLALATLIQVVVSSMLLAGVLHGNAEVDSALSLAVLPAHLLWGSLALLPDMRRLTERIDQPAPFLTRRRLALVASSVLAGSAVVLVQAFVRDGAAPGLAVLSAALLGLVVARLAGLVAANERFVQREIALQAGAAALVAAGSRDEIQRLGAATALELAGGRSEAYAQLDLSTRVQSGLTDVVVVGAGEAADSLRNYIRQTGSLGRLGMARTLIVPIVIRERVHGVLRVTGPRPLPWHLRDGLSTLASQVALALEGAELTEDLLERRSEARFRSLVQNSNDLIAVLEPDLTVRYLTPSVQVLLGHEPAAVVGRRLDEFLHLDELEAIGARLRGGVEREGGRPELEFRLRHHDGGWRTVEGVVSDLRDDPAVGGLVLTAHDVSERRALEDQLTYQAFHDALTGLPNRALLTDRVTHALERARRTGSDLAVLFLDVDDFKTINDSLGHVAGDQLLVELARRIQGCLRGSDTAARLGGDEFAIVLEDTHGIEGAARAAARILGAVAPPFTLADNELLARASIGIVLGDADQTAGELLRNADVAMYRAKQQGGGRYEIFRPEMHAAALTRLELKAELERAFQAEELDLHYQQLVQLDTERVVGYEALLRWTHAVRGPISPVEFVPLAEETGLINGIGHWALARACHQTVEWQRTLPGGAHVSANVNLSARQILQPGFHEAVAEVLGESGLDPHQLVLEITESTLMEDVEGVSARLAELRALGVRIAIDDFGTGFSSLSYLQRFPVDELKIAKEFVDDVVDDPRKARLVEAIVRLAGSLDLLTVAEGIETPEQRDRLREMGCTLGQGYLFGRPVPAETVAQGLRASSDERAAG